MSLGLGLEIETLRNPILDPVLKLRLRKSKLGLADPCVVVIIVVSVSKPILVSSLKLSSRLMKMLNAKLLYVLYWLT